MSEYNYKVVAELKSDLDFQERENITDKIIDFQKKFDIEKIDATTYCRTGVAKDILDDFADVIFFFFSLREMKTKFKKLEFYDLPKGDKRVVV